MASYGYYNGGNMHGMHGSGNGFFNHFQRPLNWSALGKFDNISPPVQKHLQRVYATLSGGILAATLGAFLDYKFHVAGMMTQLSLFGAIIGLSFISGKRDAVVVSVWLACVVSFWSDLRFPDAKSTPHIVGGHVISRRFSCTRRCVQQARSFPCRGSPHGHQSRPSARASRFLQA